MSQISKKRFAIPFIGINIVDYFIGKSNSLPKLNSLLIHLWSKKYKTLYDLYCDKFNTPDLIHAHGYVAGFAAHYISTKTGIPYIITEHNSSVLLKHIRPGHRRALARAYNNSAALLAVGSGLKKAMENDTTNKITVVPNLVNTDLFYPKEEGTSRGVFIFLCVGGLDKLKRVMECLHAFHQFVKGGENARLVFIGSGKEKEKMIPEISAKSTRF